MQEKKKTILSLGSIILVEHGFWCEFLESFYEHLARAYVTVNYIQITTAWSSNIKNIHIMYKSIILYSLIFTGAISSASLLSYTKTFICRRGSLCRHRRRLYCVLLLRFYLNHIRLASFLWDIDKQCRPRSDAAERGV